jgi:putative oxidoreductase
MDAGRLLFRGLAGALFVGHGTQKLLGWFGGHGLEGTGQFMESLGLRPGKANAALAGTAEAGGGLLLALGLATPLAAATLTGVMATAIRSIHAKNGPWVTEGGWEYTATVVAALAALVEAGPGDLSLDRLLGIERKGTDWALVAVGAGVVGSSVAYELATRMPSGDRGTDDELGTVEANVDDVRAPA